MIVFLMVLAIILLAPFIIYTYSKIQMAAWIKAIEEDMIFTEKKIKKLKEALQNGKEKEYL